MWRRFLAARMLAIAREYQAAGKDDKARAKRE